MQMQNLVFIGNSNIITVVCDMLRCSDVKAPRFDAVYLVDDNEALHGQQIAGMPVIGGFAGLEALRKRYRLSHALITISENHMDVRAKYYEQCRAVGFDLPTILHPASIVSASARIGQGVVLCAGAIVGPFASLGDNSVIFTGSTIDHHTRVGASCIVGPGVHTAGGAVLRDKVFVGVGAVLLPRVEVGEMAVVGAGAVVTKNVPAGQTVIGVPARIMEKSEQQPEIGKGSRPKDTGPTPEILTKTLF